VTRTPDLRQVALRVGDTLRRHGIEAVLTGGACAALHSGGVHQSVDADFVLTGVVRQADLDLAMSSIGFTRRRDRYVHPELQFFIEFPRGPLAVGGDANIRPERKSSGRLSMLTLSATDSCRDRLAAYYHWNDRHSLEVAVEIARRNRVNLSRIRRWSRDEGAVEKFEEFRAAVKSARD